MCVMSIAEKTWEVSFCKFYSFRLAGDRLDCFEIVCINITHMFEICMSNLTPSCALSGTLLNGE